ncbi:hypothetical protein ACFE04_027613 [Oxalis oulophora]
MLMHLALLLILFVGGDQATTHSPDFLGLTSKKVQCTSSATSSFGDGVIVGLIDSGIWPESESFRDTDMPPVPKRWRGKCEDSLGFNSSLCNRKIIGAKTFVKFEDVSARDSVGHGTHTSSTAAGNYVLGASYMGYGRGTARGIAPRAHIAMYKVVEEGNVLATDLLAAIDQAIHDGVDVLSLSIGNDAVPYFRDIIAIASFAAVQKGIFVACSAGNDGEYKKAHNGAPWITTLGAGTMDRSFKAEITLGNGKSMEGTTLYPNNIYISNAPLYHGSSNSNKTLCRGSSLNHNETAGKVILCDSDSELLSMVGQIEEIKRVGAIAGILISNKLVLPLQAYDFPLLILQTSSGNSVKEYIKGSRRHAKVKSLRFQITELGTQPAPQVSYFSSRGPNPISPAVLKPDILAPGMNILAAYVPNKSFMRVNNYDVVTDYMLISGTSMATPHIAGVAALLKSKYPEWSPAAIRSAMMTSAYTIDNTRTGLKNQQQDIELIDIFTPKALYAIPLDYGAGHIDPVRAMDPGLIYDIGIDDYVQFLCGLNYTEKEMKTLLRSIPWSCSAPQSFHLNYPSFVVIYTNATKIPTVKSFERFVTNVALAPTTYKTVVVAPARMIVRIEPEILTFSYRYEKLKFVMTVQLLGNSTGVIHGSLKWIDDQNHIVSSPILAMN